MLRAHTHICLLLRNDLASLIGRRVCETLEVTGVLLNWFLVSWLYRSRGTEHSLANSVQRSYALEWEARIDHPCVPAF